MWRVDVVHDSLDDAARMHACMLTDQDLNAGVLFGLHSYVTVTVASETNHVREQPLSLTRQFSSTHIMRFSPASPVATHATVRSKPINPLNIHANMHTHTHTHIYIYIYILYIACDGINQSNLINALGVLSSQIYLHPTYRALTQLDA